MSESDADFDDPFRAPPPMDYSHEEEEDFGAFSRGYDIEDIVHPKPDEQKKNKLYNFYGMGVSVSSKRDSEKDQIGDSSKFSGGEAEKDSMDTVKEDKFQAFNELNVNKEPDNISWSLKVDKSEDTQSVSSLELSFNKGRLRDLQDGDTQSVSSNEFGNFESVKNTSINPESKSVDSLDLHQSNENSGDQIDEESNKPPLGDETQNSDRIGIVEIYRVSCRITLAMVSLNLSTEKLKQILRDVDLSWNNLTAFLVGGNLMPDDNSLDFSNALLKSDDATSQMKACGVCLLNVDTRSKNFNQDDDCAKLTYGGRQYHSTCANFWLNCVDPMLPALKLPELL
ncbi:hypothetical protein KUTeg_009727 [Tegillarca granosa]|uniref:Synergin gamma C-terminal domain-containing protein n=1 Tax=Tegillarca granosa TaxID=220873 RepID=A0ABQ9F4Q7_TEGGR|nr:hypothetical protein KUTeg_009727 [Tegillarca granosa]